jgi:hypothetical protein
MAGVSEEMMRTMRESVEMSYGISRPYGGCDS